MSYYSKEQLESLNKQITNNIEDIARHFKFKIRKDRKHWSGCCPIHGGDNSTALNIYHTGDIIGNWKCRTHFCEKTFYSYPIGFIRGLLAKEKGWEHGEENPITLEYAVNWTNKFFGNKGMEKNFVPRELSFDEELSRTINTKKTEEYESAFKISRDLFRKTITFPCDYYIKRGFSEEILDHFDIGVCLNPEKPMYGRAVVPIYDEEGTNIVACTGRSVYDQCKLCKSYHNPLKICPSKDYVDFYTKWKHSKGFSSEKTLYNYSQALSKIRECGKIIIVEGCGSVWRLKQAGYDMAVANFGLYFNRFKRNLLDRAGVLDIIILRDKGKAGDTLAASIAEQCQETHNIIVPEVTYRDDIGECDVEFIQNHLKGIL